MTIKSIITAYDKNHGGVDTVIWKPGEFTKQHDILRFINALIKLRVVDDTALSRWCYSRWKHKGDH